MEPRIGHCRACHARFTIPATFRADRARCRECGGVVLIGAAVIPGPVPRPNMRRERETRCEPSSEGAPPPPSHSGNDVANHVANTVSDPVVSRDATRPTTLDATPQQPTPTPRSIGSHPSAAPTRTHAIAEVSPRRRRRALVIAAVTVAVLGVAFVAWRASQNTTASASSAGAETSPSVESSPRAGN